VPHLQIDATKVANTNARAQHAKANPFGHFLDELLRKP